MTFKALFGKIGLHGAVVGRARAGVAAAKAAVAGVAAGLLRLLVELGEDLHHKEGVGESGWILLDFGDIIVNLFTKAKRDYYNIEKIWADCDSEQYEPERN